MSVASSSSQGTAHAISTARRLIVNADDFGRSASINLAVIRAHREGILTTASLMVNEPGREEAVALAKENPGLGVGLHLTLLCSHSALAQSEIPGLVNSSKCFSNSPAGTGLRYFFQTGLREQLRHEIAAQLEIFSRTGLVLDHVNGHLHMHLHPVVFDILMELQPRFGFNRIRLTRDLFWLNLRLASGRLAYRALHAIIYHCLSAKAAPVLRKRGIRSVPHVFGLLQDSRVDESYLGKLLEQLPPGDSELYSHPSLDEFKHELEALVSPRIRRRLDELGIRLIRYQDL
jgi:hopanoid biosynthesis associated protein HpnK